MELAGDTLGYAFIVLGILLFVLETINPGFLLAVPATVLLDRQGRALGRMVGPAEWDSDDAIALFRHFIGGGS